jgi:sulfite reductase alpha subunit-like flavoprotein
MKPIDSTFYIPEGRPLVMIANGSGIAPFRSVVQYVVSNKIRLPYMRLYFGIQNE